MSVITYISNIDQLNDFLSHHQEGSICFKDYCPSNEIESCLFSSSSDSQNFKISEHVMYPYDSVLGAEPKALFDRILSHDDANIYFLVSANKPNCLRYCEQFMARLQIYMEVLDPTDNAIDIQILQESVPSRNNGNTLKTPCIIGITSNIVGATPVPAWSFHWHIDEDATKRWLKSFLLEIAENYKEEYSEKKIYYVFKKLQPTLHDISYEEGLRAEELERYRNNISKTLERLMKELELEAKLELKAELKAEPEPISLKDFIYAHPHSYNAVIQELSNVHSWPHELMIEKSKVDIPDGVEVLKKDYSGIPIVFKKSFGKGSVTVIPEIMENGFLDMLNDTARESVIEEKIIVTISYEDGKFYRKTEQGTNVLCDVKISLRESFYRFLVVFIACRKYGVMSYLNNSKCKKRCSKSKSIKVFNGESNQLIIPVGASLINKSENMSDAIKACFYRILFGKTGKVPENLSREEAIVFERLIITGNTKCSKDLSEYIDNENLSLLSISPYLIVKMSRDDFEKLKNKSIPSMIGSDDFEKHKADFFSLLEKHITPLD